MFTKHSLREIPAGEMIKYRHTISKSITDLLSQIVSSTSEFQRHCTFTSRSVGHQPLAPEESTAPPVQHRQHKSSCLGGQRGNLVSISPCLSRINIPGILELADGPVSTAACTAEEREDGTQLVSHLLTSVIFFYHMTGFRYHST